MTAGEHVARKQGSDHWIINISGFIVQSRGALYEGRARRRKEKMGQHQYVVIDNRQKVVPGRCRRWASCHGKNGMT